MMIRMIQARYYWLIPLLSWSVITAISLFWNLHRLEHSVTDIARERGRIMYQMVHQTKVNPLLMQNNPDIFKKQVITDIEYRMVSSRPRNPENMADSWEKRALSGFSKPEDFRFERQDSEAKQMFRYIGPVFMQANCLPCHGYEHVKVGDLRGGISVTINARPIYAEQAGDRKWVLATHLGGFLLLAGSTLFLLQQLRHQWGLLTETRDRLKQQEDFLSSITHTMGEGCVVVDREGVVTFVNPESEWILGWDTAEMLGQKWIGRVTPESNAEGVSVQSALMQTLSDGIIRREEGECFLHKDGLLIPVAYSVSAMYEEEEIIGAVLTFNDISERKRAEEERSRMERQLNQTHKMEAVGQLAGGIAHEINTPIQYIGENLRFLQESWGDVNTLLESYQPLQQQAEQVAELRPLVEKVKSVSQEVDLDYIKEEAPKCIEQSLAGTEQVARIVLAMKEFAHPGAHQMALADLNKIIQNSVAVSKNEWKYVADTELLLDPDLPNVECLGGEISQVLLNLIVNAAHTIEDAQREGKGKITISTLLRNGRVEVSVTDTGTGIPKALRESIFNPFFTTKDVGQGTGQGLAIAQDIVVHKHRGQLFFETEEGQGTTFTMQLPLTQSKDERAGK
ncbi:MAG: ATP-binding protein [Candidatus Thiodiazotropha sp.]